MCTVRNRHVADPRQPYVCRQSRGAFCIFALAPLAPPGAGDVHLSKPVSARESVAPWEPFDTVLRRSHACARGFATSAVVPAAAGTGAPAALSLPP